jgi:phosphoribosylglycinamide formyltransferase-1
LINAAMKPKPKIRVGVLLSGNGSVLQALIDAAADPAFPADIVLVLSNKKEAYGLERARAAGIEAQFVSYKQAGSQADAENKIDWLLRQAHVDVVCLAGYIRILSADFVERWEGRILNTHPALLPKYGGKGFYGRYVHEAVLAAGEKESGMSIHIVTAGCDEGPVIMQECVPIDASDTPETLAARVLKVEHKVYPRALRKFCEDLLSGTG